MSNNNPKDKPDVQAEDNSVAVGSLSLGGSIDGSLVIGSNNIIGFTPEQVAKLLEKIKSSFQPKPFDGQCPYKGLDVFEEDDADLFFGRERLVEELVSRVKESRTVFITGPSGSGKSSLVRAGLIHTLKQGSLQELQSERWLYAIMKPGRDPIDALANALSRLKSPELGKYLRQNAEQSGTLNECVESILTEQKNRRLVLFIDQFEEIFTQAGMEEERASFLNLLTHAASKEDGRIVILFAMRSDFIPNCATYPQLNDLLNRQFIQVGPMQPDELVSAIAQPALRVGLPVEPGLIVQVINEMQGQAGVLPLMQFALKDLFDSQKGRGGIISLTLSDYLKRGGIHKALERHADISIAVLDENEKELARSIFSGLIEVGRGTQDTRRTAMFRELVPADRQAEAVQSIVRKLADARLITTDEQTVTISHEKLIDAWPWLKKLVNENRDVITLQNEITEHAREWDEHQRDESYLYTGARLVNAKEKLETKKLTLSGLTQQFVLTSIDSEEGKHRTKRRERLVVRGILATAILLIIALSYSPLRSSWLNQQAKSDEMIAFQKDGYALGDSKANVAPKEYLANNIYPIEAFSIDSYPVTNKRFNFCVEAGICRRPNALKSEYANIKNTDKLVVNITALDAAEFCAWLGMRLPSEKEWEVAAKAGAFKPISPDALNNNLFDFYEFTSSSFDKEGIEWTDISMDPPGILVLRGGQLNINEPFKSYLTKREQIIPTQAIQVVGFRCAFDR